MATVFTLFKEVPYKFLVISRGNVYGNMVTDSKSLTGVFKRRQGMTSGVDMELRQSSATLHAHPEDFADYDKIIGNGVEVDGEYYQILGMTEGKNFDNGITEHLTFTLGAADFVIPEDESDGGES